MRESRKGLKGRLNLEEYPQMQEKKHKSPTETNLLIETVPVFLSAVYAKCCQTESK